MPGDDGGWLAWKEQTFGSDYIIWHDGLAVESVTRLEGAARDAALRMLRVGLARGDAHAAQALAAMGDRDSHASVRAIVAQTTGGAQVKAALAAHALSPDPALAEVIWKVLLGAAHFGERIDAAIALVHFDDAESAAALDASVRHDGEYLVRYHAAETLLRRRDARAELTEDRALFALICSNDTADHARAADMLGIPTNPA